MILLPVSVVMLRVEGPKNIPSMDGNNVTRWTRRYDMNYSKAADLLSLGCYKKCILLHKIAAEIFGRNYEETLGRVSRVTKYAPSVQSLDWLCRAYHDSSLGKFCSKFGGRLAALSVE